MKKIVIALVAATALVASEAAYEYEITPTIGGVKPEGNLGLKDQLNYGLRLGKNVEGFIFDQIELGIEHAPRVGIKGSDSKTDITRYFANIIKEYDVAVKTKLYALAGVGYEHLSNRFDKNHNAMFGQYGLGVKYQLVNDMWLKADVRHAIKFDHGANNLFYTVGLGIPFGPKAVKVAPVEPTPVAEPAPKPAPAPMSFAPVPEKDTDGDGVIDRLDECPNTPMGVEVGPDGCAKVVTLRVTFDFDKAKVAPEFMHEIEAVADFLKTHEVFTVRLEGHTDSKGAEAYNQTLSQERAKAVANELTRLGVKAHRISTVGFGEMRPVATNDTEEGRALNRRVETKFKD
ncbi:MAG: OmpA family protein [Campylobacterales bacterium]|nr:OmpA family protein [Campylobacterales bacterium]